MKIRRFLFAVIVAICLGLAAEVFLLFAAKPHFSTNVRLPSPPASTSSSRDILSSPSSATATSSRPSEPCPERLLADFLRGESKAVGDALSKTATSLEEALRNPEQTCFLSLTGAELDSLPPEIGRLHNLLYLNLAGNKIASLPREIGELKELREINLNDNQLTELPAEFFTLTNVRTLALVRNKLTELSAHIGKMQNVNKLYLIGNPMTEAEADKIKKQLPHTEVVF